MIPLPVKFDGNEWFIVVSIIITYTIIFLLPRLFPPIITILIFLSAEMIAKVADITLGIPPYDLYDINDTPKFDLFDLILWVLYPPFGYLVLYIYEKYKISRLGTAFYIIICSIFSLGFEWMTVQFHVFQYKGWIIWYSFPIYILVISLYLLFYRLIKWNFILYKKK